MTDATRSPKFHAAKGRELSALLTGNWLTDLAQFSAFVYHEVPGLNWAGFYLAHRDRLVLGPFVGKPACTEILFSKGVCGAAFSQGRTLRVADVHDFPGHIACDPVSRSELVLPLIQGDRRLGVFDMDSPHQGRFTKEDEEGLADWVRILLERIPAEQLKSEPWIPR